jgi:hypothetical protein
MKNRLDYLKEQFLKNIQFNFIQRQDITLAKDAIDEYSMALVEHIDNIKEATNEAQFLDYAQQLRDEFLHSYAEIRDKKGSCLETFRQYYIQSHFDDLDKWYHNECVNYQDKTKFNFFTQFGFNQTDKEDRIFSHIDVVEKAYHLLDKYQLKSINLKDIYHQKEANLCLDEIDTQLTEACHKLGIKPEAFGLESTLGLNIANHDNPSYSSLKKEINIPLENIVAQHLTHEWIHALDNFIGFKTSSENIFSSENTQLTEHYNLAIQKANDTIKKLTRHLFNQHSDKIEQKREEQIQLATDKFLSLAIGEKWYGLSENQRTQFKTDTMLNAINNYMISVKKEGLNVDMYDYCYDIINNISNTGVSSEKEIIQNLKSNAASIMQEVLPYYEKINQNLIGKPSLYYRLSSMGSWVTYTSRVAHQFHEKLNNIMGKESENDNGINVKGNTLDKNYFIQPTEMLARYFESQLYPISTIFENLVMLAGVYKMSHDAQFESIKHNLLSQALGEDMLINPEKSLHNKIEHHRQIHMNLNQEKSSSIETTKLKIS